MKLGSHVSNNGMAMLQGSIAEALTYGANCFMVYLGAPQNTIRKPVSEQNAEAMKDIAYNHHIDLDDIIVHAPYIVNLARQDVEKHQFAVDFLAQELRMVDEVGLKYMVFHPGSAVDGDRDKALQSVSEGINQIIRKTSDCKSIILIETMAGKGNEVGRDFKEIKTIIDGVYDKERVGVCLDTCHINDAGYDLVNFYDTVFKEFETIIGFNYLKAIHLNDSMNPLGSHKDRHQNIGFGTIGFETLVKVANDERFKDIPKILETPYIPTKGNAFSFAPYKEEIEMIKSGIFNPNLKEEVVSKN